MLPVVPAAFSRWRIRPVVVVFPLVPVTPTRVSRRAGWPNHAAPSTRAARRPSRTRISGTPDPEAASTTTALAPRPTASGTKRCPSACEPRTARYTEPGPAERLSAVNAEGVGPTGGAVTSRSAPRSWPSSSCHVRGIVSESPVHSAHTVTDAPGGAGSPAAGAVRTTRPRPRRLIRSPRRCSASAASRTELPATLGTGTGAGAESDFWYGQPTTTTGFLIGPPVAAEVGPGPTSTSGGARRPRSIATRREASDCWSIVRVTGAAVRPP